MKIKIMTDTNSGMTTEEAKELGVELLPMPVIIDHKDYLEGVNVTYQHVFSAMKKDKNVSTSQPSPSELLRCWEKVFDEGYDSIIYIPMSSGLSGSVDAATMLSRGIKGDVHVVDNKRISLTQKLSVLDALKLVEEKKNPEEIVKRLHDKALCASIFLSVETLDYLKKSGRVGSAAHRIGSVLDIKPILSIKGEKLEPIGKVRGTKRGRKKLIEVLKKELEESYSHVPTDKLVIGTAGTFSKHQDEEAWRKEVQEAFPSFNVQYQPLSCSIASHVGEGAYGLGVIEIE